MAICPYCNADMSPYYIDQHIEFYCTVKNPLPQREDNHLASCTECDWHAEGSFEIVTAEGADHRVEHCHRVSTMAMPKESTS